MSHKKVSPWSLCLKHDDRDHPPRIGKEPFHLVWKVILTRKIFSCLILFKNLNENVRPPPVESKKAFKLLGEPSSSNLTNKKIWDNKRKTKEDILKMYLVCAINLPGKTPLVGPWKADRWHEKLSTINVFVAIRQKDQRWAGASSRGPHW